MDALQEQFECWVGDQVIKRYNTDHGMSFQLHQRAGEAPDLEYRDGSRSLKVEVSTAYYDDKEHAKFVWLAARKQPEAPHKWSGVDFDKKLVENINERPNAGNTTAPTVCLQFTFSLSSAVSGRWNYVLKTSAFPRPILLMRSFFAVTSHRQNSKCGNSSSK
jgi:hypothetical protein